MDELNTELKRKLDEAARHAPPDYPNWKRGIGCGAVVLIVCVLFFAGIALVFPVANKLGITIPLTLILTLLVAALVAFRPQK